MYVQVDRVAMDSPFVLVLGNIFKVKLKNIIIPHLENKIKK